MSQILIIGSGPDGLAAALRLARAGEAVQVWEPGPTLGGVAAGGTFADGFEHDGLRPIRALSDRLQTLLPGLELAPARSVLVAETARAGAGLLLTREPAAAGDQLSPADAAGLRDLDAFRRRVGGLLLDILGSEAPALTGGPPLLPLLARSLALRGLGRTTMMDLLRLAPGSVEDLLSEFIEEPRARAGLAASGLAGTWMAPRSPSSATTWLIGESLARREARGGSGAVVAALIAACRAAGVVLETGVRDIELLVRSGRVVEARRADGPMRVDQVIADTDPLGLLALLPRAARPPALRERAGQLRQRGVTALLYLGLRGSVSWACRPRRRFDEVVTPPDPVALERAFDPVKYGQGATRPALRVRQLESVAPAGHTVAVVEARCISSADPRPREAIEAAILDELARFAPDVRERIVAHRLWTPADLAAQGVRGGHLWGGELALDQLWVARPGLGSSRGETGISGLWLASPSVNAGCLLAGQAGLHAAAEALAEA